jgi:two-component system nitrogen regulation sensor histidine kinase NtrY
MVSNRFRFLCAVRVGLIALSLFLSLWLAVRAGMYATASIVGAAVILQVWSLLRFVERTGADIERFLESIIHADSGLTGLSDNEVSPIESLPAAYNEAVGRFNAARAEKEEKYLSLLAVVQHAGIGLLAFHSDGSVVLLNPAARRLLGVPHVRNIHELEQEHPGFVETLLRLTPGDRATMPYESGGGRSNLTISAASVTFRGNQASLLSLTNIQDEMEEN